MLTIKCAGCHRKLFKYNKIGQGRVLRCWKDKIVDDFSEKVDGEMRCGCGNVIGIDIGKGYKMKQNAFIYSGTKSRK